MLSIYLEKDNLRIACAFTMALVCGMHYTGMLTAVFGHDFEVMLHLAAVILAFADLRQSVLRMDVHRTLFACTTLTQCLTLHWW